MKPEDAEEYTQALGQVVAGGWRQIALGQRLGVPKALNLSTEDWVKQRLGGYVQLSIKERQPVTLELQQQGLKQNEIASILGVDEATISRDLANARSPHDKAKKNGQNSQADLANAIPLDTLTALATTNEIRQQVDTKDARAKREEAREQERQVNAAKVANVTDPRELLKVGRFATIVIDPPWDFEDEGEGAGGGPFGRTKHDYASVPIDELLTLPVDHLADTDCHLYLCITNRSLPKGFRLMDAWGFRYITCVTWVKPSFGIGNYFRGQTEQILFGVKGSQPLKRKDVGTVFEAPRGARHSEKPDALFALIESCSPGPFLEMYQRVERPGWTGWGEESQA